MTISKFRKGSFPRGNLQFSGQHFACVTLNQILSKKFHQKLSQRFSLRSSYKKTIFQFIVLIERFPYQRPESFRQETAFSKMIDHLIVLIEFYRFESKFDTSLASGLIRILTKMKTLIEVSSLDAVGFYQTKLLQNRTCAEFKVLDSECGI